MITDVRDSIRKTHVVPAKAGTRRRASLTPLGPRLRGDDGEFVTHLRNPP